MIKILKIIIYSSLFISLLSSSIYLFFPDLYVSYVTGYSVDFIVGYRTGNFDYSLLCKDFFPREISQAIGKVETLSFLMFIISLISVLVFKLFLIIKKGHVSQSKNTMRNLLIILFLSFLMSFMVFISDYTYNYILGCEQLQADCERLRASIEEFGGEDIKEFHARGEFLYCD